MIHIYLSTFFLYLIGMLLMRTSECFTLQSESNIPQNTLQNIDTTFYNNNFSTAVGYVSTKMGREDIRDAKKPYATTNIYNPGATTACLFHFTQIHSKLVNCYSCSSGLTVRELVVHVTNPTFCANQIWRLY